MREVTTNIVDATLNAVKELEHVIPRFMAYDLSVLPP